MNKFIVASFFLWIGGCATNTMMDYYNMTEFHFSEQGFEYEAVAPLITHPHDDRKAEEIRLEWLERYLSLNGCSDYVVTDRQVVVISKLRHRVDYKGRCLSEGV